MKIDLSKPNPAFISIIKDPNQIITLDANFLIPPSRSSFTNRELFTFDLYKYIWLDPIFKAFPNLAIHQAVYDELVDYSPQSYINIKRLKNPPEIIIHQDSDLSEHETNLRNTFESKIASHTKYVPLLDNKDDRGEVKSLSYIAVKGLLYFSTHDNNTIQLIEKSNKWSTGLDNVQAIKMYELIYYLHKNSLADKKALKMLYKHQYYLTSKEKSINPEWGRFTSFMNELYLPVIDNSQSQ